MKLDSFKEILIKKSIDNNDLNTFIKSIDEDTLYEYVSDLLEKSEDFESKRHFKPNEIVKKFGGGLTDTQSGLLYGQLSHHASKYIAAHKAVDKESDPQKKAAIQDAANKHAAAFMTSASLAQKISKDAASSEKGLGTNHSERAPVSIRIGVPDVTPWQRHANTNRFTNESGKVPGHFSSVAPGLAFKGKADFSYLHKKPHPGMPLKSHEDDVKEGFDRKNSTYPIQNTKIHFKNNETGEEYQHHINIDPEEKFSGKFEPHIMDSHPIFGMHNHEHESPDHFMIRNGELNRHPNEHGGFVHTPQKHFPQDGSYEQHYNDLLNNWEQNIYEPALDTDSYKGNKLFRDFAKEKSSEKIPFRDHTDEEKQVEQKKLIDYVTNHPSSAKVIFQHHPELKSMAMQGSEAKPDNKSKDDRPNDTSHEGYISDEHLDEIIPELEKDPEQAKSFFEENPHYGWAKKMVRPQEGEEGHVSDEDLSQMIEGLKQDPKMAEDFFNENPSHSWIKRRLPKQDVPQETEQERVQRQIKEIMGKSQEPKVGIESLLKSISFLIKKNESFFNQNPELFIAVQERFVKAVSPDDEEQDAEAEADQEISPEDLTRQTLGLEDPEAEQTVDEEEGLSQPSTSGSSFYDTKHLSDHGSKYLGLGRSDRGRAEVMHDPDIFSLIRGPAQKFLAGSTHTQNLENQKNTIKHAGAKISSSEETKAHQSRQDQKNEAWKNFKNSKEYNDIIGAHADSPQRAKAKAELAFNKMWRESGEHDKDLEAHKAASANATQIHDQADQRSKSQAQQRESFLRGEPIKQDDISSTDLDPDFKFSHTKTVDGKEHHEVSQGAKKHGTVVHDPQDPSRSQFVPGEGSKAHPKTVMAAFNQEKGLGGEEGNNTEDLGILQVAPFGYSGTGDIGSEGEAKANIYEGDGDEGSTTAYRQGMSVAEYHRSQLQNQKPKEEMFQFQHNPSASSGSIAHHDVFTKDKDNQPMKVGTIVHDVKDPSGPKFQPHGESNLNHNEALGAFKSKGIKYTEGQVKSLLNPEQSKRFDSVQSVKVKKGTA